MRKKALLVGVMGLVAMLAAFGMWRDATPGRALSGIPIQPFNPDWSMGGMSNTILTASAYKPTVTTNLTVTAIPRGQRIAIPWIFSAPELGIPLDVDSGANGLSLGDIIATLDVLCDSPADGVSNDTLANNSATDPWPWVKTTTAAKGTDQAFLYSLVPPYPWILRHTATATKFWVAGASIPAAVTLNTVYTTVPWSPNGTTATATTKNGGDPRAWTPSTDANCIDTPQDSTSHTASNINPPLLGDSGGPCTGVNCSDAGVYGLWTDNIVTGTHTVTVKKNLLNNGPHDGTFSDHWDIELSNPAIMTATWAATAGLHVLDVPETLVVGTNAARQQNMAITCTGTGEGLVVVKNALWPVAPTEDRYPQDNAAVSVTRVICTTAGSPLVDEQILWIKPYATTVGTSAWQLNLAVGASGTVSLREVLANNSTTDPVSATNILSAESANNVGDPDDADIGVVWGAVRHDQAGTAITTADCSADKAACVSMTLSQAKGQNSISADLTLTCPTDTPAGRYSVVVKAIDAPIGGLGEANGLDNAQRVVIPVNCGAVTGDGIDDGASLYPRWTIAASNPDSRQIFSSPPSFPSDTGPDSKLQEPIGGYVERVVQIGCWWMDANGCFTNAGATVSCDGSVAGHPADGYIDALESQQDFNFTSTGGLAQWDPDGDCLASAAKAQPNHPVDLPDQGSTMCPSPVPYSGAPTQTTLSKSFDADCDGLADGIEKAWGSDPVVADTDLDGATDYVEAFDFTNPGNPDTDADGFLDKPSGTFGFTNTDHSVDNCPSVSNTDQRNSDGGHRISGVTLPSGKASNPNKDKMGDACDADDDNDGLPDTVETAMGTTSLDGSLNIVPDTDGDHCVDGAEALLGTLPTSSASKCPTALSLPQTKFFRACRWNLPILSTDPGGKAIFAPWDVKYSTNADRAELDADNDGISCISGGTAVGDKDNDNGPGTLADVTDITEIEGFMTNPASKDTDGDGCDDWVQVYDVNGDGKVDSGDQLAVAKRAANLVAVNAASDEILDVNKDGKYDSGDNLSIAKNTCQLKGFTGGCLSAATTPCKSAVY